MIDQGRAAWTASRAGLRPAGTLVGGGRAATTRRIGDLEVAEDAVQEACAAAIEQWPSAGFPPNPRAWLIATAWHKAVDSMRRQKRRVEREMETGLREPSPAA